MVTIAIPFYNAEQFLAEAINSVLWQTYTNWKLILLDDGSSDNSLNIAYNYAKKDNRIIVVSDGENKNLGYRLNQIPKLVNTVYLARMDADDIMHPQRIEIQINTLINHPEIDVLGTNAFTINEKNEVVGIRQEYNNIDLLKKVQGFIHPSIMAKTEWFLNNPYDVKALRIEDAELWCRTRNKSNFMSLSKPLLFYREFYGNYYKKYIKVIPSLFYLMKKYNKKKWYKTLLKFYFNIIAYFIFEKILKSNFLFLRRNTKIFKKRKNYKEYINL